ncbi:Transmembrane protein [Hirschfeldia incana]|nr:Transmembrane protein [Hirschfeldia incana]
MKGRAYVMIFFFWALLTIITPMLVSWSQALKEHNKKDSGPRRMMGYSAEMFLTREIVERLEEEEQLLMMKPSMAPTPEDSPVLPSKNQTSKPIKQQEGSVTKHKHPMSLR